MSAVRDAGPRDGTGRRGPLLLPMVAVLVVQTLLVGHAFPWTEVLTQTPILGIDHPFHLYQVAVATILGDAGHLTGYDPFFAAGYVGGVTFNASAKGPALLAWLLQRSLSEVETYKLYVFVMAVLAPVAATGAAALARMNVRQVAGCGVLAIGLWWASEIHWYQTAGLVSFVAVSFLALPYCVLLDRLVTAERAAGLVVVLGIAGALLFLIHPFFVIPVALFGVVRLCVQWPTVPLVRLASRLVIVGVLCLIPNLPWLLAMRGEASIGVSQYSINYQTLIDSRLAWMNLLGLHGGPAKGAKINPLLAALALLALFHPKHRLRVLNGSMVLTWVALVLFAAFGAALPFIGSIQPNRFASTAYVLLLLPAAVGIGTLLAAFRAARKGRRYAGYACAGLFGLVGLAVADEVRHEMSYGPSGRYGAAPPDVGGLGPKGRAVLDWLKTSTSAEGRVLFETSLARVHDGGHIVGYLQLQSGREFIGGPYNNFFAGTRDGWMFGRPLVDIEPQQFLSYLRLYNIGWIVVHSDVAKRYLARFPGTVEPTASFEHLQTYVVRQKLDFVEDGRGPVVSAAYGKLVVRNAGEQHEPIVLRYHYVPGLHATDQSTVEPVLRLDDPTPFIKVTPRGDVVELVR